MKRKMFILCALTLIYSCTTEDANTEQETNNFYALTVGNSWEYNYYLRDMMTNDFMATPVTETVSITETVQINNDVYYNFKYIVSGNDGSYSTLPSNGEKNYTFRDSLGYLIDNIGLIKYNNSNYNEYFVDYNIGFGDFSYYLQLSETEDNITTNAGNFSCYDNHYFFKDLDGNYSNSVDHIYREDGKGEVMSTMSFISQNEHYAEKRLEVYNVQ